MGRKPKWLVECPEIYCVTCGTQVLESGRVCPRCLTPVQVSRSVALKKNTNMVSVLGASGAGKTVFLGMLLDMLSKGCNGMGCLPNGSFTLEVQENTVTALETRRFPPKTQNEPDHWNWVHCEAFSHRKPGRRFDVITPDIAGEVLAHELEHAGTSTAIRSLLINSHGLIILLDAQRVRKEPRSEDIFAVKLATYVEDLRSRTQNERRKQVRMPLAFVLTKSDGCPEAEKDPQLFANANLPGLIRYCTDKFQSFTFSAASVVGRSVQAMDQYGTPFQVPLHIQPRGIVEPLDWILARLEKKWARSR